MTLPAQDEQLLLRKGGRQIDPTQRIHQRSIENQVETSGVERAVVDHTQVTDVSALLKTTIFYCTYFIPVTSCST